MIYATSDDYMRFYGSATAEQLNKLNGDNNNTESALGYSQSITFNNAGGGIYLKQNDLKQLGWLKQKIMLVDPLIGGMND